MSIPVSGINNHPLLSSRLSLSFKSSLFVSPPPTPLLRLLFLLRLVSLGLVSGLVSSLVLPRSGRSFRFLPSLRFCNS